MSQPTFSRADVACVPGLVGLVARILSEQGSHKASVLDEAFWRWQYAEVPSGPANTYVARLDGAIVGYYHVPVYTMRVDGRDRTAGVVQDVAVSREFRGRGLFRRLAAFATADLARSGVDFAYTFPNAASIGTFLRHDGYRTATTLDAYVRVVDPRALLAARLGDGVPARWLGALARACLRLLSPAARSTVCVERHADIDDRLVSAFRSLEAGAAISLRRDRAWLEWRFRRRPQSVHHIFSVSANGDPIAVAVFKHDEMFGRPTLLLMDFGYAPGHEDDLACLVGTVARAGPRLGIEPFDLVFTAGTGRFFRRLHGAGFLRVPSRLSPRSLHLLSRDFALGRPELLADPASWHVTLADWDVF